MGERKAERKPAGPFIVAIVALTTLSYCASSSSADDARRAPDRRVAARVDGEPILVDDVRRQLNRVLKTRSVEAESRAVLETKTLQQLVDRRLVLNYLAAQQLAANPREIDLAVSRARKRLAEKRITLPEFLESRGLTDRQWRSELAWQLSWQRYLARQLTDENREKHFIAHKADYDGRRVRVAHILLPTSDGRPVEAALEDARRIRREITDGTLSFAEAAGKYSKSPTAKAGGDVGWIERRSPMPESFSAAAFALEPERIGPPVTTRFGVHLIRCLEIEPGQRSWQDARALLADDVAAFLFRWAADRQRPHSKIELTGALPEP